MTNEIINNILSRRSVRKFRPEQVKREELEAVLLAGTYAPCAGSRQSCLFGVCRDQEVNDALGKYNREVFLKNAPSLPRPGAVSSQETSLIDDPNLPSGFYGAPTVVTLFAPKGFNYAVHDCVAAAENMLLAARSLGLGGCFVGRAEETFQCETGSRLMAVWGIDQSYEAKAHVLLGYPLQETPQPKARKENRIRWM